MLFRAGINIQDLFFKTKLELKDTFHPPQLYTGLLHRAILLFTSQIRGSPPNNPLPLSPDAI
ncbi:hypothetical protein J6590_092191 [Homalodisca vitripennis]|nr:hypothetical protein J6590_092191 [Homalodisca vitripennis]